MEGTHRAGVVIKDFNLPLDSTYSKTNQHQSLHLLLLDSNDLFASKLQRSQLYLIIADLKLKLRFKVDHIN
jgi:hypothetical protein